MSWFPSISGKSIKKNFLTRVDDLTGKTDRDLTRDNNKRLYEDLLKSHEDLKTALSYMISEAKNNMLDYRSEVNGFNEKISNFLNLLQQLQEKNTNLETENTRLVRENEKLHTNNLTLSHALYQNQTAFETNRRFSKTLWGAIMMLSILLTISVCLNIFQTF